MPRSFPGLALVLAWCAGTALAQPTPSGLKKAFDAAWARQPEAQALPAQREAVQARQRAAQAWTPEPAALSLSSKSDRLLRNRGARELEVGVAVPIWLPGERARSAELAAAEAGAAESRASAAQLRLAAALREAWWGWQRARAELDIASGQRQAAQLIAADVARRLKAGDLARADQHQADGAVAAAELAVAQAQAALAAAGLPLQALTGLRPEAGVEAEPAPADTTAPEPHPVLIDLQQRAAVAERAAALAGTQSRANPELTVATGRERGAFGEDYGQAVTLALRIPFGGGARHEGRVASARAELAELQAQLALERERLQAERQAAQARVEAATALQQAAERRAQLARESRGFFDKSFRLGETDLPTRLRIEAEAAEAERQAARAAIERAAAGSAWRQALGLLPQ
jgi:cobalt-zinc-cadmium efflux system outer membrane protein